MANTSLQTVDLESWVVAQTLLEPYWKVYTKNLKN
jgi:hypothetical protein